MTENERMSISGLLDVLNTGIALKTCHMEYAIQSNVFEDLIGYLEELEQYRAIGTVEDFKALKEKKSEWKYSRKENIATCKNCSYEHYLGTYHQYATNYCPKCGSKMTEN